MRPESDTVTAAATERATGARGTNGSEPRLRDPRHERRLGWVGLVARLVLGVALLVAGGAKVGNPMVSARTVQAYQLLPFDVAAVVGYALPVVEIIVGILLVAGLFTRASAALGTLFMLVFIAAIASAWARGLTIDCGCFGGGGQIGQGQTQYPQEIARDALFAACGLFLLWRPSTPFSVDRRLGTT